MKTLLIFGGILLFSFSLFGQNTQDKNSGITSKTVDLRTAPAITILRNSTQDTLKFDGLFFNWLPNSERPFSLQLAPGASDSLSFRFNYPDFIQFDNFRVLNAPNGRVICDIKSIKPGQIAVDFSGDYALENAYYLAYANYFSAEQETSAFYKAGNSIQEWNKFPAIADSITQQSVDFLQKYQGTLPAYFKRKEQERLKLNNIFRKYNVVFSKEFSSGTKIDKGPHYYDFEKDFPSSSDLSVLSTEYLMASDFYLSHLSHGKVNEADPMISKIDSLYKGTDVGDVLKMRRLFVLYTSANEKFLKVYNATTFKDEIRKQWADSLIKVKLATPIVGKKAPLIDLRDEAGNSVSLLNFRGKHLILNFWASWCAPCIKEFPSENNIYKLYKDQGLVVVNICVETPQEQWRKIGASHDLKMVNLFLPPEVYSKTKRAYDINSLPRSIMVDPNGVVTDNYLKRASLLTQDDIKSIISAR